MCCSKATKTKQANKTRKKRHGSLIFLTTATLTLCFQNITRAFIKIWANSKRVYYPLLSLVLWLLVLLLFIVRVGSVKTLRRTSDLSESSSREVRNSLWRSKQPTDAQPWRSAELLFWNPFKTQKHSSDHTHSVQIASASASNFLSGTKCFYYPAGSDYIDPCVCPLRSEWVFFWQQVCFLFSLRALRPRQEAGSDSGGSRSAAAVTQWNFEVPHGALKKVRERS